MGDTVDWSERREARRQRTFKRGRVMVNGVEVARCTIRDMSLDGARVVLPDAGGLPDTFVLSIGDEELVREVNVRSRTSTGAGVQFTRPLNSREMGADFLRHTSKRSRSLDARAARDRLLERARAGVERIMLGEDAPALAMPDEPPRFETHDAGEDDDQPSLPPPYAEGGATGDASEEADAAASQAPDADEPDAAADQPDDAAPDTVEAVGTVPAEDAPSPQLPGWDDGRGEGSLGTVPAAVPPRAIRRLLPWGETLAGHATP